MRVLVLPADAGPRERGLVHGRAFGPEIGALMRIRMHLTLRLGRFASEAEVLEAAERHLPVLRRFDPDQAEELAGIAEGAGLSAAEVVLVNHYTDLRDLDPEKAQDLADAGCSIALADTAAGAVVAQTWDMHATAIPFVMMLGVPPLDGAPAAWLFTLTGCLGMTGLNDAGVSVSINNLWSTDAKVGVVWPALVRRALRERTVEAAVDVLSEAPVGSGHHYLVAGRDRAVGIETSGGLKRVVYDGPPAPFAHTNHALDPEVAGRTHVWPNSTTYDRLERLGGHLKAETPSDVRAVWQALGSVEGWPRSVNTWMATPENPHLAATCGAIAMDLERVEAWAEAGLVHNVAPHRFPFPVDGYAP